MQGVLVSFFKGSYGEEAAKRLSQDNIGSVVFDSETRGIYISGTCYGTADSEVSIGDGTFEVKLNGQQIGQIFTNNQDTSSVVNLKSTDVVDGIYKVPDQDITDGDLMIVNRAGDGEYGQVRVHKLLEFIQTNLSSPEIWLTKAEYASLASVDPTKTYFITEL